jgi:predicted dehydrogenase
MNKVINVGIVGIGWWASVHAEALKKNKFMKLVTCYTRNAEKAKEFAYKYNCNYEDSYINLLKRKDLDAVIITTPHTTHKELAIMAANSGKHALVEKPLANTVKDCKEIIEAFENQDLILAVGHDKRWMGQHRKMKEMIKEGKIGRVIFSDGYYFNPLGLNLTPDKWRFYREESPGGSLAYLGIHMIDTLRFLLGSEVYEVTSMMDKIATPAEIDDVAIALLKFENHTYGFIASVFVTPRIFNVNLYCTEANLFSNENGELYIQPRDQLNKMKIEVEKVDPVLKEQEDFALSIISKKKPEVDGYEGMKNVAIIEAIIRSAKEKRTIKVESF